MGDMSKAQQRQSSHNKVSRERRRGAQITERNKVFNIIRDVKRQDPNANIVFKNASVFIHTLRVDRKNRELLFEHEIALDRIGTKTGIARLKQFINACPCNHQLPLAA